LTKTGIYLGLRDLFSIFLTKTGIYTDLRDLFSIFLTKTGIYTDLRDLFSIFQTKTGIEKTSPHKKGEAAIISLIQIRPSILSV
jgi:hypothetical protein